MNFLDIVFAVPLLWAAFRGVRKGLIFEVATLVALVLGVWGGIHFSDLVSVRIASFMEGNLQYLPLVSFCITFGVVVGGVLLLGKVIEKIVNAVALSIVNKILGAAFAMVKIGFILSVILVIVDSVDRKIELVPKDVKDSSLLYTPLKNFSLTVIPALENSQMFNEIQSGSGEAIVRLPQPQEDLSLPAFQVKLLRQ